MFMRLAATLKERAFSKLTHDIKDGLFTAPVRLGRAGLAREEE